MELIATKVTDYKCVLDSDWFSVDDLTALVGKNESGKTAILEAMERLNSADSSRSSFRATEYPRLKSTEFGKLSSSPVAISAKWKLDSEEIDQINSLAGVVVLKGTEACLAKDYENKLSWSVDLDYAAAVKSLVESSGLTDSDRQKFAKAETVSGLISMVNQVNSPTDRQSSFKSELGQKFPSGSLMSEVSKLLSSRLPKIVYYSSYDRLPGRVPIDQILAAKQNGTLDQIEGSKVFLSLLSMVDTTPEQLQAITTSEDLISKLEGVQAAMSRTIFKYWSQNKHLKIRFIFGEASPGDPLRSIREKCFRQGLRIRGMRRPLT